MSPVRTLSDLHARCSIFGGCILYPQTTNPYGLLSSPAFGRTTATRAAWILANGPIPAGMKVLHRCDNTRCCNPDHLFLGTQQDNIADMWIKGRAKPGNRHLSKAVVFQIFQMREQGATISNIAGALNVKPCTVAFITSGRNHKKEREEFYAGK